MAELVFDRLKNIKDEVRKLLLSNEVYRDNDEALVAKFHYDELVFNKINPKVEPISKYLNLIHQKKLTPADTITRVRRNLQEKEKEIRGRSFHTRHGMSEDLKKQIRDL